MTLNQFRAIQICNKFIIALVLIAFCILTGTVSFALEKGTVTMGQVAVDYSLLDKKAVSDEADAYFSRAMNENNEKSREELLKISAGKYFVVSRIDNGDVHSSVQLGRIYDLLKKDRYAKSYFSRALGIDDKNADANYYFGDFYLSRHKYNKALDYYKKSFSCGKSQDTQSIYKMGLLYEKLGDLNNANSYYKRLNNAEIQEKVKNIESLDYKNSQYYKMKVKKSNEI